MLILSEVLMQQHQLNSYQELVQVITEKAKQGEVFFNIDVKPPFSDTPDNWEEHLESLFTSALQG